MGSMRPDRVVLIVLFPLAITLGLSCSKQPADRETAAANQEHVPAGELMAEFIGFQYAVYYLPVPSSDPRVVLQQLLAEEQGVPSLVEKIEERADAPLVSCFSLEDVQAVYAPPDLESIQYFGRGLSKEQAQLLQASELAFIVEFAHNRAHVWDGLRQANRIVEKLARETGGLLWDEMTREIFTPDEWHARRILTWTNGVPDISKHTTIHAYNTGEYVRAITLGMEKIGLPDVVVDGFSWSSNRTMGHLINLFCQAVAERPTITVHGQYDLDIHRIRNREVRDAQLNSLYSNATANARLTLKEGRWEEGDPANRLIELAFDRYSGRDVHARQQALESHLFGWEDDITPVQHNKELLAASQRAKAKLPELRNAFTRGLDPGEFIQVKAPFESPDGGHEWMWVEVTAWKGNRIEGLLNNEPFNIPSLQAGQVVSVKQKDVFDYIRKYPDGEQEGNETGKIIEKMRHVEAGPG